MVPLGWLLHDRKFQCEIYQTTCRFLNIIISYGPASSTFQIGDVESHPSKIADTAIQSMALSTQAWERLGQPDSALVASTSDKSTMAHRLTSILEYRLSIAMKQRAQKPLTVSAIKELHSYVKKILSMYNNPHFHGIEHASHVTISMHKQPNARPLYESLTTFARFQRASKFYLQAQS